MLGGLIENLNLNFRGPGFASPDQKSTSGSHIHRTVIFIGKLTTCLDPRFLNLSTSYSAEMDGAVSKPSA